MASKKRHGEEFVLTPKNKTQELYLTYLNSNRHPIVVSLGPAGSGKTWVPTVWAGNRLKEGLTSRLILTRPTVPTGRSIGFFPGTLEEKMQPWLQPIVGALKESFGNGFVDTAMKDGKIEVVPFEVIRGRTFDNSVVILDEAQNTTYQEIKAFTTRIGKYTKMIINGDTTQSDLKGSASGLSHFFNLLMGAEDQLRNHVGIVEFDEDDIVRSDICRELVRAYGIYEVHTKVD